MTMAQKITRLCDPCLGEDVESDASQLVVNLGAGFKSLDLCDQHAALLAKPLLDAVTSYGVAAEDTSRKAKPRNGSRAAASGARAAWLARQATAAPTTQGGDSGLYSELCPLCDYGANAKSAIRRHVHSHAPEGVGLTPLGLVDSTCPLCGMRAVGRANGSLVDHLTTAHAQPSVGHAVWAAVEEGDPHGVVAAMRRRAAAAGA
jgi:hypothetical protein